MSKAHATFRRCEPQVTLLTNDAEDARKILEDGRRQFDMEKASLKKEIAELHVQLEMVLRELQNIVDAKISLGLIVSHFKNVQK